MIVVADTSPINYLTLIDEINLLPKLFQSILVPQSVLEELQHEAAPQKVKDWIASKPGWLDIRSAFVIDPTITLGKGEAEAISLAKEKSADLVLIDDRKARRLAVERGLKVAGTLNVLESAAQRDLVDLKTVFADLAQTNFRVAPKLLKDILGRQT